jgi:vitamin B12 transporter
MKKKNWPIRLWAVLSAWLLGISCCWAQQNDSLRSSTFSEVMITATRSEKKPADVGRGITVITAEEIQKSNYLHLGDLLARQAGIYLVGAGQNPGMTQSLFMRGSNSNQTAVLIDGVRISDPSGVNNALDLSELALADIDRIEMVRGSHSTLYGSSAIGGVVNIITRKNHQHGFHPMAELQAGKFGKGTGLFGQKLALNYAASQGFYIHTEAENQRSHGLDATIDTVTRSEVYNNRDQDDFKRLGLTGKLGYRNQQWDVYGSYKNTGMQTDIDKRAYTDDDNAVINFDRHLFTYGAAYKVKDWLQARYIGGYSRMFRQILDDSSAVDNKGTSDQTFVANSGQGHTTTHELQANFVWPHASGVAGIGYYGESMNATSYFYTNGPYGVYEARSDLDSLNLAASTRNAFIHFDLNGALIRERLQKFSLAIGARFNQHSKFGPYTTFEINPGFKLAPQTLLFGVLASGYNAPSLYQLYSPETGSGSGITRGNPDLEPETSTSYELGVKQTLGNFRLGLSFFQTEVKNTIEYVYLWTAGKPTGDLSFADYQGDTYLNLSRQTSRGLELDFFSALSAKLQLAGNISLINGDLKVKPQDIRTGQTKGYQVQLYNSGDFISQAVAVAGLVRRPTTANINLTYLPWQKLVLRADARYAGPRSDIFYDAGRGPFGALGTQGLNDYTLLDLSARLQFTSRFSTALRVENLFDKDYQEINGFRTRGRGFYCSITYAL